MNSFPVAPAATEYLFQKATAAGMPLSGTFELTPVCNMDCKMCYVRMSRHDQESIDPNLSYTEIGARIGVSKNAVTSKVKRLIDEGILKPRMEQAPWTDEDTEKLFRLRAQGKTWNEIGDVLGRNGQACMMAHRREQERRAKKCQKK